MNADKPPTDVFGSSWLGGYSTLGGMYIVSVPANRARTVRLLPEQWQSSLRGDIGVLFERGNPEDAASQRQGKGNHMASRLGEVRPA